jgi:hypothetical protein
MMNVTMKTTHVVLLPVDAPVQHSETTPAVHVSSVGFTIELQKLNGSMSPRLISIFKDLNVVLLLSYFHEKYAVVPADNPTNTIVFVCKLHYIHCLITEVSILTVQFATLHIPWSHIRKRTSRSAIGLGLYAPWDFQSNTRTRLLDTFLSYVSFTNSDILLGLSNNPRNLYLNYQHLLWHC